MTLEDSAVQRVGITIVETTVAELEGIRIGASSFWDGSCRLSLMGGEPAEDRDLRVRQGDSVRIGGRIYMVTRLLDPEDGKGSVTLERVD